MTHSMKRATDPLGDEKFYSLQSISDLDSDLQDKIAHLISQCEQFNFASSESNIRAEAETVIDDVNDDERSLKEANEILRFEAANERQLRTSLEVLMKSEIDVAMSKLRNDVTEERNLRLKAEHRLLSTEGAFKQHYYETAVIQEQAEKTFNELKAVIDEERERRILAEMKFKATKESFEGLLQQMRNDEQDNRLKDMALLNDVEKEREGRLLAEELLEQMTNEKSRLQKELREKENILFSLVATFRDEMQYANEGHAVLERSLTETQSQVEYLVDKLESTENKYLLNEAALLNELKQERYNRLRAEETLEQLTDVYQNELKKKDEARISIEETLKNRQSSFEALQDEFKNNEQNYFHHIASLKNELNQERQQRLLSDEMIEKMTTEFRLIQNQVNDKDHLQSSSVKEMSNNDSDVEESWIVKREGEMNYSGQRLYSEAFDVSLQHSSRILTGKKAPDATEITKGPIPTVHQRNVMQQRSSATKNTNENRDPNRSLYTSETTEKSSEQKNEQRETMSALPPRHGTPVTMNQSVEKKREILSPRSSAKKRLGIKRGGSSPSELLTSPPSGTKPLVTQRELFSPLASGKKKMEDKCEDSTSGKLFTPPSSAKKQMEARREAMAPRSSGRRSSGENKDPNSSMRTPEATGKSNEVLRQSSAQNRLEIQRELFTPSSSAKKRTEIKREVMPPRSSERRSSEENKDPNSSMRTPESLNQTSDLLLAQSSAQKRLELQRDLFTPSPSKCQNSSFRTSGGRGPLTDPKNRRESLSTLPPRASTPL